MSEELTKSQEYVLIKSSFDWGDEFDVVGFSIMSKEEFKLAKSTLTKYFKKTKDAEFGFGTNEALTFSSIEDVMRQCRIVNLTEEEADTISKCIGTSYGTFTFDRLLDQYDCEDD